MMRSIVNAPRWIVYGAILLALLAAWGLIKPLITGPDVSIVTIVRVKPVPVKVERVEWMAKTRQIKRARVELPIAVVAEVPPKVEKRIEQDFQIKLPELREDGRELVDVLEIPKAPHGGEMALTIHIDSGKVDGIFRPKPMRLIQLGGIREAGVQFDVISQSIVGYYEQDLLRIGPAIVNGRVFAAVPMMADARSAPTYGAAVGVAVRL